MQALNSREPGTLPSNTQNPGNGNDTRQSNVIALRSSKELNRKNYDFPITNDDQQLACVDDNKKKQEVKDFEKEYIKI